MLKSLFIENIAVIEKTEITFCNGFNALTGETGAGKSIIIDSINAVLGERTSKELIRAGCKNAVVTAVFSNLGEEAVKLLNENGYNPDENGEIFIVRVLSNSGSTVKINGKPVSMAILRSFSNTLINVHGQHDNQALLHPENHYKYIDMLANNGDIVNEYYNAFSYFNKVRNKLKAIDIDEDLKLRKIDLLKYQIDEIKSANIKVGEYQQLKDNLLIAKNSEKHLKQLKEALFILSGDENNNGVISEITTVSKLLGGISGKLDEAKNYCDTATDMLMRLRDEANDCFSELSSDLFDVDVLSERIETVSMLMRKYGSTEQAVLEFLEKAETELKEIEFNDEEIIRLEKELEEAQNKLIILGEKLSESRKATAKEFEQSVTKILRELNMPAVKIETEIKKGRYTKNGCDEIQFLISTNAGEELKPLNKVASGGELSRVMLAIKSVLCDVDDVDTLIFDEIDSGISGMAADKVGNQLRKIANSRQTICVTHLAQIAASATEHFLIEKNETDGRTFTNVTKLNSQARIKELARIMGGEHITDNLLYSAKELLNAKNRV